MGVGVGVGGGGAAGVPCGATDPRASMRAHTQGRPPAPAPAPTCGLFTQPNDPEPAVIWLAANGGLRDIARSALTAAAAAVQAVHARTQLASQRPQGRQSARHLVGKANAACFVGGVARAKAPPLRQTTPEGGATTHLQAACTSPPTPPHPTPTPHSRVCHQSETSITRSSSYCRGTGGASPLRGRMIIGPSKPSPRSLPANERRAGGTAQGSSALV